MNKPVLDAVADWIMDCLIAGDEVKAAKLEALYKRMFDRQWKYRRRRRRQ